MPTISQHEIAPLHQQLDLTLTREDYLPAFEKALKNHSKNANIPGFRKGMVPTGLIRKMYGASLFTDEVLKVVDREVNEFLRTGSVEIIGQPLPKEMDLQQLDVNDPKDYTFSFEMGLRPDVQVPPLSGMRPKRYVVTVTDEMVQDEVERLQTRYGNMTEPEAVDNDENVLNVTFVETDETGAEKEGGIRKDNSVLVKYFSETLRPGLMGKRVGDSIQVSVADAFEDRERSAILEDLGLDSATDRHFRLDITKVGMVEKRELNEELFTQLFPGDEVKTEADLRSRIREEIQKQWDEQSRNGLHHQLYHLWLDGTQVQFPEAFLKRWLKEQNRDKEGNVTKSDERLETEFPTFLASLKWSLISDKLVEEAGINIGAMDIRQFAKQQLLGYMGMNAMEDEQPWVADYIDRMMKDRKYVEDAHGKLQTEKMFEWAEGGIQTEEVVVSKEEFERMNEQHNHEHHAEG